MFFPKISSYYFDEAMSLFSKGLTGGVMPLAGIAIYVFTALSLYTIARRRGISAPWLAWVPVANLWVLGSLSDQYRYLTQGQMKHKRIALLVWECVSYGMLGIIFGALLVAIWGSVAAIVTLLSMVFVVLVLAIVYAVLYFMALYDVYASCDPQNAALYLVLSIFFRFLVPVFLFISRDMEKGMPPRKPAGDPEI